jgi:hypothetical protein
MPKTYIETLESEVEAYKRATARAGTCDYGAINDIVDWVVRRDPDSSQRFGDAVRGGTDPYQALQDRLGHDQNALHLVQNCRAEALQSLAAHGFGG